MAYEDLPASLLPRPPGAYPGPFSMNDTYLGQPLLQVAAAQAAGLSPMTSPYFVPAENWMLQNVISDMLRGKIKFVLVQVGLGVEVWR